jgi:hypothetical protein
LRSFWTSATGGTLAADGLQTIVPVVALIILAVAFVGSYMIGLDNWA